MNAKDTAADSIAGTWHLVDMHATLDKLPDHRMDLRLDGRPGQCRGAVLNRINGEEMLLADVVFDGSELRLQMLAPLTTPQEEMPWLVVTRVGPEFVGQWTRASGDPVGPMMKLIRASSSQGASPSGA